MSDIKVGICGVAGRMGRTLVKEVTLDGTLQLTAALEDSKHADIGKDSGIVAGIAESGVIISEDQNNFFSTVDAVIDFSLANTTISNIKKASEYSCCYVLGTTGLDTESLNIIKKYSENMAIIMSSNMSVGVNIALYLTRRIAGMLDEEFDAEIHEIHHKEKIDSPSGTAISLGKAVAEGRKVDLAQKSLFSRVGEVGERKKGQIGFSVQRGGDVVGDHTVTFAGPGERLELSHKATSRVIFAKGAIRGLKWLISKPPGLYDMQDVLELK